MDGLSIDPKERHLNTKECPSCMQPDDLVMGIVRKSGRACIAYDARRHNRRDHRAEVFVDIAFADFTDLDFDDPDTYFVVFSCHIMGGRAVLVDAPAAAEHDPDGVYLTREEALADYRHAEWSEVLALIVGVDPILRQVRLDAP